MQKEYARAWRYGLTEYSTTDNVPNVQSKTPTGRKEKLTIIKLAAINILLLAISPTRTFQRIRKLPKRWY